MATAASPTAQSPGREFEWPTWMLLVSVYLAWLSLTFYWQAVPGWLLGLLGAMTIALHSSLQHEAIHGHPTRWHWLNIALVWPPLTLWLPVELYDESHTRHHASELAHPEKDPESFYLPAARWATLPCWRQWILLFNHSFAGRMLIGPWITVARTIAAEQARLRLGDRSHVGLMLRHAISVAAVLCWVLAVCDMPVYLYLLAFVWPGTSLMLVRSFIEHRYDPLEARRTVYVDGCPLTRLLFLNNNFHWVHHARPGLAWYRIPAVARAEIEQVLAQNGNYRFPGYFTIAATYLFRPWTHPAYPD